MGGAPIGPTRVAKAVNFTTDPHPAGHGLDHGGHVVTEEEAAIYAAKGHRIPAGTVFANKREARITVKLPSSDLKLKSWRSWSRRRADRGSASAAPDHRHVGARVRDLTRRADRRKPREPRRSSAGARHDRARRARHEEAGQLRNLVTHGGQSGGMHLFRRRAMRAWLFDQIPPIAAWTDDAAGHHFDIKERLGDGPLLDICAALCIPAAVPDTRRVRPSEAKIRMVEVDAAAAAVAFLHSRATHAQSSSWLAIAWRDLSRYLIGREPRDHLMPLIRRGIELGDVLSFSESA